MASERPDCREFQQRENSDQTLTFILAHFGNGCSDTESVIWNHRLEFI